ncbi:MAG TPA: aldose epimerase [Lentisphaeria bacterium]|nr:MAG: hypothetical protein A2X47_00210 [Lentisphaerae bacterium GWF2_38_69]HBM14882.1 aldose epimerase [Lentisphaeria bacterium]
MQEIKCGNSSVKINETGAELKSFRAQDKEIVWQTIPAVWNSSAPVLFPFVGLVRNNRFSFDGKEYQIGKHGFVRNKEFSIDEKHESSVKFLYSYSEETLKSYPFKFEFFVNFSLVSEKRLIVEYEVKNVDSKNMFFSLGSHPALDLPMKGTCHEDYYIEFEQPETVFLYKLVDGLLERQKTAFMTDEKIVKLGKHVFDDDALIFTGIKSRYCYLKNDKTKSCVSVCFDGAPDLGIWAKPGADYVCIEPWFGYNDPADFNGSLEQKPGIISLKAEKSFTAFYAIELIS